MLRAAYREAGGGASVEFPILFPIAFPIRTRLTAWCVLGRLGIRYLLSPLGSLARAAQSAERERKSGGWTMAVYQVDLHEVVIDGEAGCRRP